MNRAYKRRRERGLCVDCGQNAAVRPERTKKGKLTGRTRVLAHCDECSLGRKVAREMRLARIEEAEDDKAEAQAEGAQVARDTLRAFTLGEPEEDEHGEP